MAGKLSPPCDSFKRVGSPPARCRHPAAVELGDRSFNQLQHLRREGVRRDRKMRLQRVSSIGERHHMEVFGGRRAPKSGRLEENYVKILLSMTWVTGMCRGSPDHGGQQTHSHE